MEFLDDHGYGSVGVTFTSASESYSHFASAATVASLRLMADLIREL